MLITLIGRLFQFAIMFASVKIMTNLLTPEEMGKSALIITTTNLFALFLINPVGMFLNRRMHAWIDENRFKSYLGLYVGYLIAVASIAAGVLVTAYHLGLDLGLARLQWMLVLVCGSLVFNTISTTLVLALNMIQRTLAFTLLTLGTLTTCLCLSIFLNHTGHPSAERWMTGTLIGQTLFALIAYFVLFRGDVGLRVGPIRITSVQWSTIVSFCWPLGLAVLMQWLHMQGYRFLLANRFGLAQLGMYAAGYGIAASLMSAYESLLTTWYLPAFYRMANSADLAERGMAWSTYARFMVPASFLGMTALVAASPSLPKVLLGSSYHDTGQFVLLGALAEWARMMVGVIGLNAHLHMKTRRLVLPNLVGAIATYLIMVVMIRPLGLTAAPISVFIGSFTVIAYLWLFTYRHDPHLTLDWRPFLGSGTLSIFLQW